MDIATAPVGSRTWVEVEGRKIFYQEAGDPSDPAVVFFHGAGASPSDLPVLLEAFARRGFFAVAPEHPGMGRSEHLSAYSPDFFKRYAVAYYKFLRAKNIKEPILVAQSFGGGPANASADLQPGDVGPGDYATDQLEAYRPKALVLVDALMGQPPSRRGLSGIYGFLLRNLEPPLLRLPWTALRHFLMSFITGTPRECYRGDFVGDVSLATELGTIFSRFARGKAPVEVDYLRFVLGGTRPRPLILIWGELDGTRFLDYGEWGSKLTTIYDARALYDRVHRDVAAHLAYEVEGSDLPPTDQARRLVRFSIIRGAGHAGIFTRSHMDAYLDELVNQLRGTGVLESWR